VGAGVPLTRSADKLQRRAGGNERWNHSEELSTGWRLPKGCPLEMVGSTVGNLSERKAVSSLLSVYQITENVIHAHFSL